MLQLGRRHRGRLLRRCVNRRLAARADDAHGPADILRQHLEDEPRAADRAGDGHAHRPCPGRRHLARRPARVGRPARCPPASAGPRRGVRGGRGQQWRAGRRRLRREPARQWAGGKFARRTGAGTRGQRTERDTERGQGGDAVRAGEDPDGRPPFCRSPVSRQSHDDPWRGGGSYTIT